MIHYFKCRRMIQWGLYRPYRRKGTAVDGFSVGRHPIIAWMDFGKNEIVHLWDIEHEEWRKIGIPTRMLEIVVARVRDIVSATETGTSAAAGASE